jgi:hypothetical protein
MLIERRLADFHARKPLPGVAVVAASVISKGFCSGQFPPLRAKVGE